MRRIIPWILPLVFLAGLTASSILHLLSGAQTVSDLFDDVGIVLSLAAFAGIGALVVSRQPRNVMGWLFAGLGLTLAVFPLGDSYATYVYFTTGKIDGFAAYALWMSAWYWMPLMTVVSVYVPMLYPTGRFLSKRWMRVSLLPLVATVGFVVLGIVAPTLELQEVEGIEIANPFAQPWGGFEDGGPIGPPLLVLWMVGALAAVASAIVRFRRSRGEERLQMKWFAFAVALTPLSFIVEDVPFFGELYSQLTWVALPVATGIAILKYRLYDIDVVISKTLVFGGLAAFITAIYVGIVVGVGNLLGAGGEPNLALSIVATAVVAVAFQPVRERLTRLANRLVFGRRATPYEVLSRFSEHLGEVAGPEQTLERMARLLVDGTGAARAQVWLRTAGGRLEAVATWPAHMTDGSEPETLVEVTHEGETLGALSVDKQRGESLTPTDVKLITDLAAQTGLVLRNLRLTEELKQRIVDLQASRQRLVAAQDAERHRLERDLHDGARRQLLELKSQLAAASSTAAGEQAVKAGQVLEQVTADADDAVATLGELAHGIFPPLLAAEGLAGALRAQAAKAAVPVVVEPDGIGRYNQEVEAAVYFCVLEAVQNATKYANPSQVTVQLGEHDGQLTFEVSDDGGGFDPATTTRGRGTTNMTDRLDALQGHLDIRSVPGSGTVVAGRVPTVCAEVAT